jgi:hypothetical protein
MASNRVRTSDSLAGAGGLALLFPLLLSCHSRQYCLRS